MSGSDSSFPLMRLAHKYNEARTNGQLLSNRAVIEILQTRMEQLLARIDENEAPDRLAKLQRLWVDFRDHEAAGRQTDAAVVKILIDNEFEAAYHDYASWKQMFEAIDLHRKTVETEVKIFEKIHGILTVERAYELVAELAAAVIRTFPDDPVRLRQIQYEFSKIVGEKPDPGRKMIDAEPDEPE